MKKISQTRQASELVLFILTGGIAALVNIGLRYALTPLVGYSMSILVAFLFAMTTAWILARLFVFPTSTSTPLQEYTKFAIVNVVALLQVWSISIGLDEYLFPILHFNYHPETVAHVIGVIFPVFPSYVSHKYFTFKRR